MNRNGFIICCLIFITLLCCKEKFEPNLPAQDKSYLIVEGFINSNGPTQITLSRSSPINEPKSFRPETNAAIYVEGEDNSLQLLRDSSPGQYLANQLNLNLAKKYRIYIKTKDGKEYRSDLVSIKQTPPIDSISWREENGGVMLYANTHDPQNNTRYYRWNYEETWEIRSEHPAVFRYINGTIRQTMPGDPNITNCWKYDQSKTILLGSSAKFQSDVIHLNPLIFIPYGDERIGVRYSLLLRQYAMDKSEYEFMLQMKKNTESLGTIFDPQPSAISGNIYCVSDPNELVIGYVGATSVSEKRVFIKDVEVRGPRFRMACEVDTVGVREVSSYVPPYLPFAAIVNIGGISAYEISYADCVDCRLRGSNVKPSYW